MQEPFDLHIGTTQYAVFPEGDETYTIFKEGKEHLQIQRDAGSVWIKFDYLTELPIFEEDVEVDLLGKAIDAYEGKALT